MRLHPQLCGERAQFEAFIGQLVGVLEFTEAGVVVVVELVGEVVCSALQADVVVRDVLVGILDALEQATDLASWVSPPTVGAVANSPTSSMATVVDGTSRVSWSSPLRWLRRAVIVIPVDRGVQGSGVETGTSDCISLNNCRRMAIGNAPITPTEPSAVVGVETEQQ